MKLNISFLLKFAGVAAIVAAAWFSPLGVKAAVAAGIASYVVGHYFSTFYHGK